jgi:hypothetical protein
VTDGACVGAAVHKLHCAFSQLNPSVHEQRFAVHSAFAQLQTPCPFPGMPHFASS